MWEAFHTGFGARPQPLFLAITTAGHDRSSVCWEQHEYAKGVLDGTIIDHTFHTKLFSAGQDDDWTDEKVWEKANPCLDVSLSREYLRAECRQAQEIPGMENSFRRLHLNQWTEQEKRVIPMHSWDKCKREFSEADMYGRPCYAGLDLSSTRDATAFVLVFPEPDNGFKILPWFWIPKDNIDRQAGADKRQLLSYGQQGHIEMTDGNEIDVFHLASRIVEICDKFEVQYIGYDPWNSTGVIQAMVNNGLPENVLVKMPQTFATYNEPFKRMLAAVENQKLEQNGNNVLRWMAGNTAAKEDPSGNMRPDKGKSADKIDGICAMLMGMALSISYGQNERAYMSKGSGVVLF
jgi:phage terminase large subunit-like protein